MNSPTSAPVRATRNRTQPLGWRTFAAQLLDKVQTAIDGAMQIERDSCPHTLWLLRDATKSVAAMALAAATPDTDRGDMHDHLYHLEAVLLGAQALEQTPEATRLLLAAPLDALDKASDSFDLGGLPDESAAELPAPAAPQDEDQTMTDGERRAYWVFGQIRGLADLIEVLFLDVLESIPRGCDDEAKKVFAGQSVAAQIGLLAHIGEQDVGGLSPVEHKDAREFLLPPSYHDIGRKEEKVVA